MTEMYGVRFSYGLRGDRWGMWVDHRYQEIMIVGWSLRYGVPHITTSDGMDVITEKVEDFKKRIAHDKTGGY